MVDEISESEVQLSPGAGERAAFGEIGGHERIEQSETGRQHSAVCLGEQDGGAPAEWGELVVM